MRLLDLFCGAGGASEGYRRAGFTEIVGVDLAPQPRYPFTFVQSDAIEYLRDHLHDFDAIHASPPCQRFSTMTKRWDRSGDHPDLVEPTRDLLQEAGVPYVIENVEGAPLLNPVRLCGSMFDLGAEVEGEWQQLRRHRLFEANVFLYPPGPCQHRGRSIGVYGNPGGSSKRDGIRFAQGSDWKVAMGVDWMNIPELTESIPPAYTEWLGAIVAQAVQVPR